VSSLLRFPAGFGSVGFSGSRSLSGRRAALVRSLAASCAAAGLAVLVGCAAGADRSARLGAPGARVFRASAFRRSGVPARASFAARSVAFVRALAASPRPLLVSAPGGPCPARARPGSAWVSGVGGSWASAALAAGLGVPVAVLLPAGVAPPAAWGPWALVSAGPLAGAWFLSPPPSLF
jgi:hypothetical protein